ncbi:unnamed protein product [Sphagnum jensenii]|uniref:Secreted protein n=1 Tax=Sphagnum jensenii TaxID=128206 RepID=A0ABP1BN54_9BRYO
MRVLVTRLRFSPTVATATTTTTMRKEAFVGERRRRWVAAAPRPMDERQRQQTDLLSGKTDSGTLDYLIWMNFRGRGLG